MTRKKIDEKELAECPKGSGEFARKCADMRGAKEKLKVRLQGERVAVGLGRKTLEVRIITSDPEAIERIKKMIPEEVDGFVVNVEISGEVKPLNKD